MKTKPFPSLSLDTLDLAIGGCRRPPCDSTITVGAKPSVSSLGPQLSSDMLGTLVQDVTLPSMPIAVEPDLGGAGEIDEEFDTSEADIFEPPFWCGTLLPSTPETSEAPETIVAPETTTAPESVGPMAPEDPQLPGALDDRYEEDVNAEPERFGLLDQVWDVRDHRAEASMPATPTAPMPVTPMAPLPDSVDAETQAGPVIRDHRGADATGYAGHPVISVRG